MKIPHADQAIIAQEKLCEYLLNPAHRRGGSKAKMLLSIGYRVKLWQQLEADLRAYHLTAEVESEEDTDYGTCYVVIAPLPGPNGLTVTFRSVWQIDTGTDYPR